MFTPEETLAFLENNGIIDLRDVEDNMRKARKEKILKEHPYVDIYLPDGTLNRYLIFASYETEDTFPYTCRFDDDKAFKVFLNRCRKASYYDSGIQVSPSDRILTLVTCTKTYNEASRIIVQAVLIQQDK